MLTKEKIVDVLSEANGSLTYAELAEAILAAMPEPLAVLADRKGVSFEVCPPSFYVHNVGVWDIGIGEPKKGLYTSFEASTYSDCEAKARAYLEGLEDKGGR